jgi:predicted flap endonuclease-1-like 5' DNA nuclease
MAQAIILIFAAIVLVVLFVWILRSRTGAADHLDTSATAVGAVVEAARNIAEEAAHKIEHALQDEERAPAAAPAEDDDLILAADQPVPASIASLSAEPEPVAASVPTPVSLSANGADNLRQLKGVGPKLATLLTELNVTRFDQIAQWTDADIARIDPQLGTFKGRIVRDNWVEQARFLAAGDVAGFEARFGRLDRV